MGELLATRKRKRQTLVQAFWDRVRKTEGCWLWEGLVKKTGYGFLAKRTTSPIQAAHRLSWKLHFGEIQDGLCVCHKCDNKLCVNPEHLFLGTAAENIYDCVKKGRHARGERRWSAKLTVAQVLEIRSRHQSGSSTRRQLANEYGIGVTAIGKIVLRERWREV